jgi:LCP family protein required for cell wall assembly
MSRSPGSPLRAFLGRFLISLLVATIVVTAVVVVTNREIDSRIAKIPRVHLALAAPPPEGANFLLIGSDTREFVDNSDDATRFGDAQTQGGQRSDTMMVAHVEPGSQRTFVVSFPRDLMVNVPGYGRMQINAAYSLGGADDGAQLLIDTLDANFGIKINHYVEVDFRSFRSVVDTIGHVRVYIPGKMRDQESGLNTPYGGGCFPLSGDAALSYVRARHLEIADPNGDIVDDDGTRWRKYDNWSDLERIPRQQNFIRKLAALAISKSLSDPFLAVDLAESVLKYVTADQALGRGEVNDLVKAFRTVDVNDPTSLEMVTLPVVADPADPNRVIPADGADAVVDALNTFGGHSPKALPAPSQVSVDVIDATGKNFGPGVVEALGDQGFKAKADGTASTTAVSEIRYAPGQLAAAEALLAYVPDAKFVPDATATRAVTLVVGSGFTALVVPTTTTTLPGQPAVTTTTAPPTTTTTLAPEEQCLN